LCDLRNRFKSMDGVCDCMRNSMKSPSQSMEFGCFQSANRDGMLHLHSIILRSRIDILCWSCFCISYNTWDNVTQITILSQMHWIVCLFWFIITFSDSSTQRSLYWWCNGYRTWFCHGFVRIRELTLFSRSSIHFVVRQQ
jgi:hypothetical protein